jgi:hypothetical protein
MAIRKQEFYEGAALHLLARGGRITALKYEPPFFTFNNRLVALLKYSARGRSPWGFTFVPDEQAQLRRAAAKAEVVIGLICGSDGVVAFGHQDFIQIASAKKSAIHVSCYRNHGEHYEVNGPDGTLPRKIAPSNWAKIL